MRYLFNQKSITLLELVIGMCVLAIIVLAISQLDLFSNSSVLYAQRRSRLTNEASMALEHISSRLKEAIGTVGSPAVSTALITAADAATLRFWVDSNGNYMRDAADVQRAYRWRFAPGAGQYMLRYCNQCTVPNNCVTCVGPNEGGGPAGWGILVARDVIYFGAPGMPVGTPVALSDNFVSVEIQVCNNPDNFATTCNTLDNPQVNMQATIDMPCYSTN